MNSKTTIVVANGVVTMTTGSMTVVIEEGSIDITQGCGCQNPENPEEPSPCVSQPTWDRNLPTTFGFIAGENGGEVQFFPAAGVGEPMSEMPQGFWVANNIGSNIGIGFSASALSFISSMEITVHSNVEGEEPITFEAVLEGSGISGMGTGNWQFVAGNKYCVTVVPTFSVE